MNSRFKLISLSNQDPVRSQYFNLLEMTSSNKYQGESCLVENQILDFSRLKQNFWDYLRIYQSIQKKYNASFYVDCLASYTNLESTWTKQFNKNNKTSIIEHYCRLNDYLKGSLVIKNYPVRTHVKEYFDFLYQITEELNSPLLIDLKALQFSLLHVEESERLALIKNLHPEWLQLDRRGHQQADEHLFNMFLYFKDLPGAQQAIIDKSFESLIEKSKTLKQKSLKDRMLQTLNITFSKELLDELMLYQQESKALELVESDLNTVLNVMPAKQTIKQQVSLLEGPQDFKKLEKSMKQVNQVIRNLGVSCAYVVELIDRESDKKVQSIRFSSSPELLLELEETAHIPLKERYSVKVFSS